MSPNPLPVTVKQLPRTISRLSITLPRYASTQASSSTASSYPFSSTAIISKSTVPESAPTPENLLHPRKGASLINHLNTYYRTVYDPLSHGTTLFSRRDPNRLRTGSIISVTTHATPAKDGPTNTFSGLLMGMRRRGVDTSFRLRNIVNKVGIEQVFKVCSPMIKQIKVVRRAERSKGPIRDLRKAKVNWIREKPGILSNIASAIKQDRIAEHQRAQ